MFCENCGNKIQGGHKFCTKCGHLVDSIKEMTNFIKYTPVTLNEKWWHRLLKVIYIFLYLQILWIVPVVWSANSTSYVGYYGGKYEYKDTPDQAFLYSALAVVIFLGVLRLIKISVKYITLAQKPEWDKEFKKLF